MEHVREQHRYIAWRGRHSRQHGQEIALGAQDTHACLGAVQGVGQSMAQIGSGNGCSRSGSCGAAEAAAVVQQRGGALHGVGSQLAPQSLEPIPVVSAQMLTLQPEHQDRN